MKKLLLLLPAIFSVVLLTSCSDDGDGNGEPFSKLTVEENKEIVEQSAIQMATTMDDMKELETTDVAVNLGNILDQSDPFESTSLKSSKISTTVHVIAGLQSGRNSFSDLFLAMKAPGELQEDPETIQELWDEIKGTYTYNSETGQWDYTSGGDVAQFLFPSSEGSTTNDAAFTISEYQGVVTPNPIDEEYDGDLPTSLKANLSVDGTKLIDYTFGASYNNDGIPSKVASELTIETFSFSVDITNSDTEVSANYKMMHGETTVMDVGGTAKGLFTQENIDENTVVHTDEYTYTDYVYNDQTGEWDEVERTEVDEWEEVIIEEVLYSAKAHWQVFDIAIKGDADVQNLGKEIREIYPDETPDNFDWEAATKKEVEAINKYVSLRAVNVTANEKIAEVEAYVYKDTEYDDYWTDFRLKFGDGSFVDFETYLEEGFDDLVAELNTMIGELNSEYDWELEEIDY